VNTTRNCVLKHLSMTKFHYEPSEMELIGCPLPKFIKAVISVIKTKFSEL